MALIFHVDLLLEKVCRLSWHGERKFGSFSEISITTYVVMGDQIGVLVGSLVRVIPVKQLACETLVLWTKVRHDGGTEDAGLLRRPGLRPVSLR